MRIFRPEAPDNGRTERPLFTETYLRCELKSLPSGFQAQDHEFSGNILIIMHSGEAEFIVNGETVSLGAGAQLLLTEFEVFRYRTKTACVMQWIWGPGVDPHQTAG